MTHFVEASLFFFSMKIRLCAWDLFGPGSDRYMYNQVGSRVTMNTTSELVSLRGYSFPNIPIYI